MPNQLDIGNSPDTPIPENERHALVRRQIEIIAERTKKGGDGIALEVHQANEATFQYDELRSLGHLKKMVDILLESVRHSYWVKADRIMNMVLPKETFAQDPDVRKWLQEAYGKAIADENKTMERSIRKLAPWIAPARALTAKEIVERDQGKLDF